MSDIVYTPPASGGTGNISGTLTPTYVPYASGVNTITNSNIYFDVTNTYVGIGTITPQSALDINGIISSKGYYISQHVGDYTYIYNGSYGVGIYIGGSGDRRTFNDNDTHFFRSYLGGANYGVWNSTGLGIGTTAPRAKFDVIGGDSVFGNNNITRILGASQIIDFTNSAQNAYVDGRMNGNTLKFYGNNGTGIDISTNGYVGIGTTAPINALHINNNTGIRISANVNSDFRGVTFGASPSDFTEYSYIKWQPTTGEFKLYANPAGFGGYMTFYSNNIEAQRITSSGNIGIGTSTPDASAQLQVFSPNNNTGFLCPQLEDAAIRAIVAPAEGLMVYNTSINHICFFMAGQWEKINHSPM